MRVCVTYLKGGDICIGNGRYAVAAGASAQVSLGAIQRRVERVEGIYLHTII